MSKVDDIFKPLEKRIKAAWERETNDMRAAVRNGETVKIPFEDHTEIYSNDPKVREENPRYHIESGFSNLNTWTVFRNDKPLHDWPHQWQAQTHRDQLRQGVENAEAIKAIEERK